MHQSSSQVIGAVHSDQQMTKVPSQNETGRASAYPLWDYKLIHLFLAHILNARAVPEPHSLQSASALAIGCVP
jgi:hypothetical protein